MRAGEATPRPLCDQEQPVVLPHWVQTEQVPAGTVGAPQSWQGRMGGRSTISIVSGSVT